MMYRAALLALAACNPVFGLGETRLVDAPPVEPPDAPPPPDLDRDGIPDMSDPCIASIADLLGDWDGDAASNVDDPCPFGFDDTDTDGDGLCADIDPLPLLAGDRVRCPMAFQNVRLNGELWMPRGSATWNLLASNGLHGAGTGAVVAVESFEAAVTTGYVAQVYPGQRVDMGAPGAITIWIRTTETAAPTDVGCEVRGGSTSSTVSLRGGVATSTIQQPVSNVRRVHLVMEPATVGRNNVSCQVYFASGMTAVADELALQPGRVGFAVENMSAQFSTLLVAERDDAPAL